MDVRDRTRNGCLRNTDCNAPDPPQALCVLFFVFLIIRDFLSVQRITCTLYDISPGIPPAVMVIIESRIGDLLLHADKSRVLSLTVL